jgi:ceramide glucosyltransferase
MIRSLELIAVAGTLASIAYYAVCAWSAAAFLKGSAGLPRLRGRRKEAPGPSTPHSLPLAEGDAPVGMTTLGIPISILKPLKGTDPEMYENFRSHCQQDYPEYEVIFGVNDPADPAVELVGRLKQEFPELPVRLILCSRDVGANTKVGNLAQMLRTARHEIIVVNDSDIRVSSDYLRRVTAPLAHLEIGLVTCLYRGIASRSLGSRLESLGISTDFAAGVLVARQIEGIKFGLGSTLAFRRPDLEGIGGFETLADYLADDYQLGVRLARRGWKIELSDAVVETFLPQYSISDFLAHQLRWARTIRDSRFWGYVGLGLTFGLPWAALALVLSGGALWAWGLFGLTLAMRVAVAWTAGWSILEDRQVASLLYLLPLRDLVAFFVWTASFAGHTIHWRGEVFQLRKGKLIRKETPGS